MTRLMLVIDTDKRVDCPYRERTISCDDVVFYKCRVTGRICEGYLNNRPIECPLIPVVEEMGVEEMMDELNISGIDIKGLITKVEALIAAERQNK